MHTTDRCGMSTSRSNRHKDNHSRLVICYHPSMLNVLCLKLLADREKVSDAALRLFLCLAADFDLRSFRSLPHGRMVELYGQSGRDKALKEILRLGLLERGPVMRGPATRYPGLLVQTYRIPDLYLLSRAEIRDSDQMIDRRRQRESLLRPPVVQ